MTLDIDFAQLSSEELLLLVASVYIELSVRVGHEGAKAQLVELIVTGKLAPEKWHDR